MLKMIDLFSGIGGIRLAFESHNVECVMSSEIDKYAIETYELNFGETPRGDISKIISNDIPNFDILAGGFPCQPFSIAGKRLGFLDTRGTLFFEIERILRDKKPSAFLLENVAGIVNHDNGNTLKVIEYKLNELGYIFKWKLLNAKDYGIPQNRDRWYCVGFLKELNINFEIIENRKDFILFNFPNKISLKYKVEDILESEDISGYDITETSKLNINKHLSKHTSKFEENRIIIANEIRPSRCNFRSDGISPCLTAKMGTGGNNIPVVINKNRKLTEYECLRIMGFPETYKIKRNKMQSYKQIGNSVVVPVVSQLAGEIVRVLNLRDINS